MRKLPSGTITLLFTDIELHELGERGRHVKAEFASSPDLSSIEDAPKRALTLDYAVSIALE